MRALKSCLLSVGLLGLLAEPALAQIIPGADYGGAAFRTGKRAELDRGYVGLRVAKNARSLRFDLDMVAPCTNGKWDFDRIFMKSALEAEGTFADRQSRTDHIGNLRRLVTVEAEGRVDRTRASGTARLIIVNHVGKRRPVVCRGHRIAWQMRARQAASATPGPARAGVGYYGTLSQSRRFVPHSFSLLVSADGTQVRQTIFNIRKHCPGVPFEDFTNISPPIKVKPDGSFSGGEHFPQTFDDAVERSTVSLSGQFHPDGSANGIVRLRSTFRFKRGGRTYRCDSGRVRWTARTMDAP